MKQTYFVLFAICIFLFISCNSKPDYSKYSKEELEKEKTELVIRSSHAIARAYLEFCNENNTQPPIYGWDDAKEGYKEIPELMQYREIYDLTYDSTEIILMKDVKYRTIMDTLEARNNVWSNELVLYKMEVSDSTFQANEEYRKIAIRKKARLRECNIQILSYYTDRFIKEWKEIPLKWIPEDEIVELERYSEVMEIEIEIQEVEQAIASQNK